MMIQRLATLLWILLFFQTCLLAQIDIGQHLLSLTGMYQRENRDGLTPVVGGGSVYNISNEVRYTSARYTPALAYVLKKKWVIGGGVEVKSDETKINPQHKEVTSYENISPR